MVSNAYNQAAWRVEGEESPEPGAKAATTESRCSWSASRNRWQCSITVRASSTPVRPVNSENHWRVASGTGHKEAAKSSNCVQSGSGSPSKVMGLSAWRDRFILVPAPALRHRHWRLPLAARMLFMFHGPVNTEGAVAVARRFLVGRIICHHMSALLAIQMMAAKMAIPAIPHTPMGAK